MGLTAFEDEEWWDRYREVVNDDPEMSTRGHDTFDENFYIDVGDDRYLIKMYEGEVEEVVADPGIGEDWTLGIEGPREAWEGLEIDYGATETRREEMRAASSKGVTNR
ncbi:hypothetical protein [Haloplanus pelagicus]|uniref:hypothetical protein n=1 Tax=Haloplanus pelagicus TaxID=2949995 RepID=UPI0020412507|nr:hypothetical protein [Haloplanus sp. HW8-1]